MAAMMEFAAGGADGLVELPDGGCVDLASPRDELHRSPAARGMAACRVSFRRVGEHVDQLQLDAQLREGVVVRDDFGEGVGAAVFRVVGDLCEVLLPALELPRDDEEERDLLLQEYMRGVVAAVPRLTHLLEAAVGEEGIGAEVRLEFVGSGRHRLRLDAGQRRAAEVGASGVHGRVPGVELRHPVLEIIGGRDEVGRLRDLEGRRHCGRGLRETRVLFSSGTLVGR